MSSKRVNSLNFGFDPEVFLTYKDSKNYDNFVGEDYVMSPAVLHKDSGMEFLTPDLKHPVLAQSERVRLVMDGVAVEVNTSNPVRTGKDIRDLLDESIDMITGLATKYNLDVSIKPAVNFDYKKYYTEEAENDISLLQGLIFGCDRDEDAFDQDFSCDTLDVSNHPYRYGGGHFHISNIPSLESGDFYVNARAITQLCAITAGNYAVVTAQYPELEKLRSSYYGKAGKYRPQVYSSGVHGVEYRTPSNNWMNLDWPELDNFLEMFRTSVDWYLNKQTGKKMLEQYLQPTLIAIKESNKGLSTRILESIGLI